MMTILGSRVIVAPDPEVDPERPSESLAISNTSGI